MSLPSVTVIGPGAVGFALLDGLITAGYPVISVVSRTASKKSDSMIRLETLRGLPADRILALNNLTRERVGELVFLSVPDDRIRPLAARLAGTEIEWSGRQAVHCSGALDSGELKPLAEAGAETGSFHPVQTFLASSGKERFKGITTSIEGESAVIDRLKEVAERLAAKPLPVNREQKRVIHLSAVFLSNYLVSLAEVADRLIRNSIPEADLDLLRPLLAQTTENLMKKGPGEALTGPISRGDRSSVEGHLQILKDGTDADRLYRRLGVVALDLALKQGRVDRDQARQIRFLLQEGGS